MNSKDPKAWYGATNCAAANVSRGDPLINGPALASGRLELSAIFIPGGVSIQGIRFYSGSTGAGTPTHSMAGIFHSATRALQVGSADGVTSAWAANDTHMFAVSPWTCPFDGLWFAGLFVVASVMPTLLGNTLFHVNQGSQESPSICGTADTGLTTALPNPASFSPTTSLRAVWLDGVP